MQARIPLPGLDAASFAQTLDFMRPRAIPGVEVIGGDHYQRSFMAPGGPGRLTVASPPGGGPPALRLEGPRLADGLGTQARGVAGQGSGLGADGPQAARSEASQPHGAGGRGAGAGAAGPQLGLAEVQRRVRRVFGLDQDLAPVRARLGADPLLFAPGAPRTVPRIPVAFDPFEFIIRAILGQQISVKAATTIAGRVARAAGLDGLGPGALLFPAPEAFLRLDLSALGVTQARAQTLRRVAEAVAEGRLPLGAATEAEGGAPVDVEAEGRAPVDAEAAGRAPMDAEAVGRAPVDAEAADRAPVDAEAFAEAFLAIKGIGPWTLEYVAMRGLGLPDRFPVTDLGVIKAMAKPGGARRTAREMTQRAERWRPYRSYAALCLWQKLGAG